MISSDWYNIDCQTKLAQRRKDNCISMKNNSKQQDQNYTTTGMVIGLAIGLAIGGFTDKSSEGLAAGIFIGLAVGVYMDARKKK